MKSSVVAFTGGRQVSFTEIDVPEPAPNEFTLQTLVTLMSMGTEMICYRGESDPGSHWHNWVKYPFYPGYSNVGQIVKVGDEVEGFSEGDRVFCTASHRGHVNLSGNQPGIIKIPEDVSSDNAVWCMLATITQTAVRQAEHIMGETAVVIGCGPIGQLVTQYLKVMGLRSVLVIDQIQALAGHRARARRDGEFFVEALPMRRMPSLRVPTASLRMWFMTRRAITRFSRWRSRWRVGMARWVLLGDRPAPHEAASHIRSVDAATTSHRHAERKPAAATRVVDGDPSTATLLAIRAARANVRFRPDYASLFAE